MKTKDFTSEYISSDKFKLGSILILSVFSVLGIIFELYLIPLLVIGLLIAIVLLMNIKWGYYITAFLLPFSVSVQIPKTGISFNTPSELLLLVLFVGVVYRMCSGFNRSLITHPISIFMNLLLLIFLISVCFSDTPLISLKVFAKYFILITTCYFGMLLFSEKDFYFPVKVLTIHLFSFILVAIVNILEHASYGFERTYAWSVPMPFYANHAIYATTAAFAICFLFILLLWHFKNLNLRFFILFCAFLIAIFALYLSYSRAAWISIIGGFAFFLLITFRLRWSLVFIFIAGLITLFTMNEKIFMQVKRNKSESKKLKTNIEEQLKSISNVSNDVSNLERINRWRSAIRMIEERPYTGFGIGTYQFEYFAYQKESEMTNISIRNPKSKYLMGEGGTTHSEYLLLSSETGIPGGIIYICLLLTAILIVYKNTLNRSTPTYEYYLLTGMGMAVITYIIHGSFNNYLDTDKISFLLYGSLASITCIDLTLKNNH